MNDDDPAIQKQEAVMTLLARFGNAMASAKRLRMMGLLTQGPKAVDHLAEMTGQSLAAASAHLKVLRESGLVISRKEGRRVICTLASENVAKLWLALRNLGEELLPEVREIFRDYFEQPETLSTLTMPELLEEMREERVLLLDLRQREEFLAGRLPNARHVPLESLEDLAGTIPAGTEVLAYCRGPYCVTALKGVGALQDMGIPVRRLPYGVPEWKAAGLPIETGEASP